MENGSTRLSHYLELNIGLEPVSGCATGDMPAYKFSGYKHRNLTYGCAEIIEPEFEVLADR
jgi:hypothetical protein